MMHWWSQETRKAGARASGTEASSLAALAIGAGMLLAACGGGGSSSAGPSDDVAGLFDVGNGRKMYLECHGTGSPTIVLISGGYEAGWIWSYALYPTDAVHDEPVDGFSAGRGDLHKLASAVLTSVGTLTRVCTYDRPNTTLGADIELERHGEISTPVAQPHRIEDDVADLNVLLNAANQPGPYVLVAHSYGGLIAELYASTFPEDVVGRVNVDVTSVFLRDTLPAADYEALIAANSVPPQSGAEAIEIGEAIDLISKAVPAPLMPAIVLVADKPPNLEPHTLELAQDLLEAQRLLARHLCAKLLTRTNSGHHIHVEQPQLVSDAAREVVEAVRSGCTTLPCDAVPPHSDPAVPPEPCARGG
jgi:pimeloyl-ACP methyl ester carboxylesterase